MRTCPKCKTTGIPDEAKFCPNCGMWLSHDGLITTLANYPDGGVYFASGSYSPTYREQKVFDYIKDADNKIPDHLWPRYNKVVYNQDLEGGVLYNTRNAKWLIEIINDTLKLHYGIKGDWIVNEHMCHDYKKSHTLLLRVGDTIYSILIVYKIDGVNVVHCEECLWQEVECINNGYVPCRAYITITANGGIGFLRSKSNKYDIMHAISGEPIEFANIHNDKVISKEEIMLLAIREFIKEKQLDDCLYSIYKKAVHVYYRDGNPYKKYSDHYILEVNDTWGNDKIEQAKKLRSECFRYNPISGRREGHEPLFYKISIYSHNGESPSYNDYICSIEQHKFNPYFLMTIEERTAEMQNYRAMSNFHQRVQTILKHREQ